MKKKCLLLGAVFFLSTVFPLPVSAEQEEYIINIPVTVSDVNQNMPEGTYFTVQIQSNSENAPMPEQTELVICQSGTGVFSSMLFEQAGYYEYSIYQVQHVYDAEIIVDTTVYTVGVLVSQSQDGTLSVETSAWKESGAGKSEVNFQNIYVVTETVTTPEETTAAVTTVNTTTTAVQTSTSVTETTSVLQRLLTPFSPETNDKFRLFLFLLLMGSAGGTGFFLCKKKS